jgi:hypothetical protein
MFHRNGKVRVEAIADGSSNTVERMSRHSPNGRAGTSWQQETALSSESPQYRGNEPSFQARATIAAVVFHIRSAPPNDPNNRSASFMSPHQSGCNFLNTDGSCRIITTSTGLDNFRALATRDGGEVFSGDVFQLRSAPIVPTRVADPGRHSRLPPYPNRNDPP